MITVQNLLAWCSAHPRVAVEWEISGRTFQAANFGANAGCGVWEILFNAGSHPTRKNIRKEAEGLLAQATSFRIFTSAEEVENVTLDAMASRINKMLLGWPAGEW